MITYVFPLLKPIMNVADSFKFHFTWNYLISSIQEIFSRTPSVPYFFISLFFYYKKETVQNIFCTYSQPTYNIIEIIIIKNLDSLMQHNELTNQYFCSTWTGSMFNISPVSSLMFKVWRDSSASSTQKQS